MKKIINDPNQVVGDALLGLSKTNPHITYYPGLEVIARCEKSGKVGVVSGGGSGHEPSFAGYVGEGYLDAAVAGNVFSSPSPDRILQGIKAADSGKGVLIIIMNYSGDIMNFDMARDLAAMEGIETEIVVVRDDVAVPESSTSTGRRGVAGTLFVLKCAGAAAAAGKSLSDVKEAAELACRNVRTMGMAMSACTLPAVGKPGFELGDNEIEIGMGIHGEPGIEKSGVLKAKDLAKRLVDKILADYDYTGSEVTVMVNGLGATPLMELLILYNDVESHLTEQGISVYRCFVGNYMTSLEMAGCSVTLLKMNDELKKLIDSPCKTAGMTV